jgi:hypothetical protein
MSAEKEQADKTPEKPVKREVGEVRSMNSNESFNEGANGGASSKFFTGFKGLFKRVIGTGSYEG